MGCSHAQHSHVYFTSMGGRHRAKTRSRSKCKQTEYDRVRRCKDARMSRRLCAEPRYVRKGKAFTGRSEGPSIPGTMHLREALPALDRALPLLKPSLFSLSAFSLSFTLPPFLESSRTPVSFVPRGRYGESSVHRNFALRSDPIGLCT